MYDRDDNYSPVSDYYGQDQDTKSFKESLGETMGNLGGNAGYYAGEAGSAGKEMVKKYLPLAVGLVVLVLIIFGIMWVLGQNTTATYNIKALDGNALSEARLIIFYTDDTTKKPPYDQTGSATHNVTLEYGTYRFRTTLDGYKPDTRTIEFNSETQGQTIELVRDIDADIIVEFGSNRIYSGEPIEGTITIRNNRQESLSGEILTKNSSLEVTVDRLFNISGAGDRQIPFKITGGSVTKETEGSTTISIKGTKISQTIKLTVYPTVPAREISITGISDPFRDEGLTSGINATPKRITIKNNSKTIPLENIKLTIVPDTGFEDKLNWFEFGNTGSDKSTISVSQIRVGESEIITLNIKPPIQSEIGDEFKGVLKIESLSMQTQQTYTMIFKVKTKGTAEIAFTPTSIKVECRETGCTTENNVDIGSIKNSGKQDIDYIKLNWANSNVGGIVVDPLCSQWAYLTLNEITSLTTGKSQKIYADLTPTLSNGKTSILCALEWEFTDPTNQTLVKDQKEIRIQINNR